MEKRGRYRQHCNINLMSECPGEGTDGKSGSRAQPQLALCPGNDHSLDFALSCLQCIGQMQQADLESIHNLTYLLLRHLEFLTIGSPQGHRLVTGTMQCQKGV